MKEELIFEGITDIREDIIERAENYVFQSMTPYTEGENSEGRKHRKRIPTWVTVVVAAACLMLVFVSPFVYMATRKCGSEGPPGTEGPGQTKHGSARPGDNQTVKGTAAPAVGLEFTEFVWIYYVEDGKVCSEQQELLFRATDTFGAVLFEAWKEKNGIGEEVQLLDFEIRSNTTTNVKDGMVEHVLGEYHCLYLTVSKNLETYYDSTGEVLLPESLEQTMTGFRNLEFQEYHLFLE